MLIFSKKYHLQSFQILKDQIDVTSFSTLILYKDGIFAS